MSSFDGSTTNMVDDKNILNPVENGCTSDNASGFSMTNNYLNFIINNLDNNLKINSEILGSNGYNPKIGNYSQDGSNSCKIPKKTNDECSKDFSVNPKITEKQEFQFAYNPPFIGAINPYSNYYVQGQYKPAYHNQIDQKQVLTHNSYGAKKHFDGNNYKNNVHNNPPCIFKKPVGPIETQKNISALQMTDLTSLTKNILEYCKDHSGSRIIQKRFEEGTEKDKLSLMEAILPHVYYLSKYVFGNYVIQIFLENSIKTNTTSQIINKLDGKIEELSFHMYGCRVIQKSIDIAEIELVKKIFYEIRHKILKCIEDQNGNHVIQKLIARLPECENREIIKIIQERTIHIVRHQYGCRVIQKILDKNKIEDCQIIINQILKAAYELSQDQYGNYAIQHIIEKQNIQDISTIYEEVKNNIFELGMHKYASNVIEKILENGNCKIRKQIIDAIILKDDQQR